MDGNTQNLEDDDGIQERMVAEPQQPAMIAIMSAVYYVSWHAYIAAGEENFPEPIAEVTEDVMDQTVDFAQQMPIGFNQAAVDRVLQYCIANHKATDDKDLGAPISRETVLEVAGWAS